MELLNSTNDTNMLYHLLHALSLLYHLCFIIYHYQYALSFITCFIVHFSFIIQFGFVKECSMQKSTLSSNTTFLEANKTKVTRKKTKEPLIGNVAKICKKKSNKIIYFFATLKIILIKSFYRKKII